MVILVIGACCEAGLPSVKGFYDGDCARGGDVMHGGSDGNFRKKPEKIK